MIRIIIQKIKQQKQLRAWALKLYSIKHPFPYQHLNMEFEYDTWNSISTLRCWNGRQIGEDNAGPYPYNQKTVNAYEVCKFKDSREGLLINITSLRIVLPAWNDTLEFTAALRDKYVAGKYSDSQHLNLIQAYLFSKMAVSLPAYLSRRKDNAIHNGSLQPVETAFYMLGIAPFMMVRQMMVRGDSTPSKLQSLNGNEFYKLADKCGVFISPRQNACPASPNLIRDYFEVFMNSNSNSNVKKQIKSHEVQRIFNLIGNWDCFYDYTIASSRLELLIKLNQALVSRILFSLITNATSASKNDSVHKKIHAALINSLESSYIKSKNHELLTTLDNVIEILILLLKEHNSSNVLDKLNSTGYIASDFLNTICDPKEGIRYIRSICMVIYEACFENQIIIHQTLGYPNRKKNTEIDLIRRTGGKDLTDLISLT